MTGWRYYKRKPKRWPWWLAGFVLVAAGVGALLFYHFSKPSVLQQTLLNVLHERGIATAQVTVTRSAWGYIALEGLSLGPSADAGIKKASLTYGVLDIMRGRLGTLTLEGVTATVIRTTEGWSLGSLDPLTQSGKGGGGGLNLPFSKIRISDGVVTVAETTRDRYAIPFSFEIEEKGDAVSVSGMVPSLVWGKEWSASDVILTGLYPLNADGAMTLTISADAVTSGKGWFAPLQIQGEAGKKPGSAEVTFSLNAQDASGKLRVFAHGVRTPSGTLQTNVRMEPLKFDTGVLQPDQVFPFLAGEMTGTKGTVELDGSITWDGQGAPISDLTLDITDTSTTLRGMRMEAINGGIRITGLAPFATAPKQKLAIRLLEAGVPLSRGVLTFTVTPEGKLVLEPTEWQWAGGTVGTEAATVNLRDLSASSLALTMQNIDLSQLLGMVMKEGLSATGVLEGRLPLLYREGAWVVEDGKLAAREKGTIRYTPSATSSLQTGANQQVTVLLQALENFHYEQLSLAIRSDHNGVIRLVMTIHGNNPERFGGKPINLNINLEGKLADMIAAELKAQDYQQYAPELQHSLPNQETPE